VQIPVGGRLLAGDLAVRRIRAGWSSSPMAAASNRTSPRNRQIADVLDRGGLATLLVDLLSAGRGRHGPANGTTAIRHDAARLAPGRLLQLGAEGARTARRAGGPLRTSTGVGAARWPRPSSAELSRDPWGVADVRILAGSALRRVMAPTLLIVGEQDEHMLDINRARPSG
jgi:hypothetical protein